MLPQQYCLRWKYHHSNLQTMFSQLLDRGCFCDVTLACEGQLIRAHRVVLCACSTFFDTVLTNYASERDPIIIMKDVTFADIKCLIEFMYKGEINVEHANLASLLKTADDLKIKGLAEVTWRDDDDIPPPPPTPQTEFHSPNSTQRSHTNMYDYVNSEQQQQQQHHLQQQQQQQSQRIRVRTPEPEIPESKASYSPKHHHHHHHHHNHSVQAQLCSRIPGLPAIPTSAVSLVTAASAAAAVAAASASAAATGINNIQHDTYMGPKRKRGRPPLDDAYDVFNVKKLTQTYGETNNNAAHASHTAHAYGENSQSNNEDGGNNGVSGGPTPTNTDEKNTSPKLSVAAAYQQHIHKQRTRQKSLRPSHVTASVEGDANMESEWINSNMEGGAADDSENKMNIKNLVKNQERNHDAHNDHDNDDDHDYKHDNDQDHHRAYEIETDVADEPQDLKITSEMKEEQDELRKRKQERRIHEKTPEKQQQQQHKSRSNKRKCSKEEQNTCSTETQAQKSDLRKKYEKLENSNEIEETVKENNTIDDTEENTECEEEVETNIKVENGENLHKSSTNSPTSSTASTSSSSSSSAATHSSESAANCNNNNNNKKSNQNLSISSSLHHAHPAYGSFCPEGYMINEHGILMAHDFVHAPTAAIPTSSSTSSMAANGQHGEDYADIKMEEFNESELRLTSEEMTQWQDVIKMDDYLAKGRRPQFWEEPFTRRVLDAIKNKRLEMKKAARILGVSYGTLYGRYRETYGCLKHPYSNTSLRNSQSNALAIPSRFDIVWPSAKPGQLDIGKLRPKDLSELWTRPQI